MNKLEYLSLNFCLKPNKPFVNRCFFPLIHDKYITFDTNQGKGDTPYRHWNEVIQLINPYLKEVGIKIIRLGSNTLPIDSVINKFDLTKNQNSYVISKSLLHLNSLNFFTYTASIFDTPTFSICSGSIENEFSFPKKENNFFYDISDKDPSPSLIASSILNFLNIKNELGELNYLCSGQNSHIKTIELIPDFPLDEKSLKNTTLNIRADLSFDENNIYAASLNRAVGVVCNSALSNELLYSCKNFIQRISYNIDNGIDDAFLKTLKDLNVNYEMFCSEKKNLSSLRLKHLNETIEFFPHTSKKDVDKYLDLCDNSVFTTSKSLISKNKIYPSKAHWITNNSEEKTYHNIIDTSDFWHDYDFMNIYNIQK